MTREVAMQPFIARDELVRERQTRHEPAFLEPKDGRERAGEKDPLDGRECHQALGERLVRFNPTDRPGRLLLDTRYVEDGAEQFITLSLFFYVRVDQERVHFRVYIFHRDLETVETSGLRD